MPLLFRRKGFLKSRNQFSAGDFTVFCKTLDHFYNEGSWPSECNTSFSRPHEGLSVHNPNNNHYRNTRLIDFNDHHQHFQKTTFSQTGNIFLTADTEATTLRNFSGFFKVLWPRTQRYVHFHKGIQKGREKMLEIKRVNDYNSVVFFLSLKDRHRP